MDLVQEIMMLQGKLTTSIRALANNGKALAQAEMEYKICLRQHALKLRDDGTPVTLINQVIYGEQEVAEKRFKRDIAETMTYLMRNSLHSKQLIWKSLDLNLTRRLKNWAN